MFYTYSVFSFPNENPLCLASSLSSCEALSMQCPDKIVNENQLFTLLQSPGCNGYPFIRLTSTRNYYQSKCIGVPVNS